LPQGIGSTGIQTMVISVKYLINQYLYKIALEGMEFALVVHLINETA
jgi:hypothetical protein